MSKIGVARTDWAILSSLVYAPGSALFILGTLFTKIGDSEAAFAFQLCGGLMFLLGSLFSLQAASIAAPAGKKPAPGKVDRTLRNGHQLSMEVFWRGGFYWVYGGRDLDILYGQFPKESLAKIAKVAFEEAGYD